MKNPTPQELEFENVPLLEAKSFFCNYCAATGFTAGWHRTHIRVDKKNQFSLVICSDECLEKFKADPRSQQLIDDGIRRTREIGQMKRRGMI
jgi:hypothetical protein